MNESALMTSRRRMLAAIHCQKPDQVPVFDWLTSRSKQE